MATRVEEIRRTFGLGDTLQGLLIVDPSEALEYPQLRGQAHYIRRAFDQMRLDAVICIDRIPTIFLKQYSRPVSRREVNELQHTFWNQGAGTVLVILDSVRLYVFSSMVPPSTDDGPVEDHDALIEPLELVANVLESCQLITRVATGQYYREHQRKFDAQNTVDQHLLNELAAVGNELRRSDDVDDRRRVHGFLGRIIFTEYLIDRRVIELQDYSFIRKAGVESLLDVLTEYEPPRAKDVLYDVFDRLRVDFNGSIFETDLDAEKDTITDDDLNTLARFLRGDEIESGQTSLGFWVYDFASIPVYFASVERLA